MSSRALHYVVRASGGPGHRINRLLRDAAGCDPLKRLFTAWEASVGVARAVDAAASLRASLCDFQMPLPAEPGDAAVWYQLMDDGVLCVNDDSPTLSASFLHPSDVGACMIAFRRDPHPHRRT